MPAVRHPHNFTLRQAGGMIPLAALGAAAYNVAVTYGFTQALRLFMSLLTTHISGIMSYPPEYRWRYIKYYIRKAFSVDNLLSAPAQMMLANYIYEQVGESRRAAMKTVKTAAAESAAGVPNLPPAGSIIEMKELPPHKARPGVAEST